MQKNCIRGICDTFNRDKLVDFYNALQKIKNNTTFAPVKTYRSLTEVSR